MAQSKKVSMKLLIDTKGNRVLFAEAGKDCVDFLFYLLSLPVATVIHLLREEGMEGSLPSLYRSLENLHDSYIEPNKNKDTYLKPVTPVSGSSVPLLGLEDASAANKPSSLRPDKCSDCYRDPFFPQFCSCRYEKTTNENVSSENGGLVREVVTYMVMDNLEVKPMSTISSITLLNDLNVGNVRFLEEKVVVLGMKETIKLLKISLESTNVLTDLFC